MSASPEWMVYAKTLLALMFVIGLIFLFAALARKMGLEQRFAGSKGPKRLALVETLYLDAKRRLVIVRCEKKEHLLLLGQADEVRIDTWENDSHAP